MGNAESVSTSHTAKDAKDASPGVSASELATAPPSEVEVLPSFEWEQALDSDDDNEEERALQVHATNRFEVREKRLTVVAAKLEHGISIGDVDVEVQQQQKEWDGDSDVDVAAEESSTRSFEQHAADSFHTREKRLSVTIEAQQEKIYGGLVHITAATAEWAGDDSDTDDDAPVAGSAVESFEGEMFTKRERRLTAGAEVMNRGLCIGDAEVQVTKQESEWSAGLSDDEGEQHETEVFAKRERRLSQRAETLVQQKSMGDAEVEVVAQESEWSGDLDSAENTQAEQHHAELFQLRERRLTVAADKLSAATALGDVTVQVHKQDGEWDDASSSDAEDEGEQEQLQRHASKSFEQREKRLSIATEALQANRSIGDAKVEVVAVDQEWESSDDEQTAKLADHEAEVFARRERRLTAAAESIAANASAKSDAS